jgi:hypothetical protein
MENQELPKPKYKKDKDGNVLMEEQKFWDIGECLHFEEKSMNFYLDNNFEPYAVLLQGVMQAQPSGIVTKDKPQQIPVFRHFFRRAYMKSAPVIDDSQA